MNHDITESFVLVHGSAGSGAQWKGLAALLPQGAYCARPDLVGYSAATPFDTGSYHFEQEMRIVEQALEAAGRPCTLVGHSFGGVAALATALARPELVDRLVVNEPVAFALLDNAAQRASHARLKAFCDHIVEQVALGAADEAARSFFDFWRLSFLWNALDAKRRKAIELTMPKIAAECALIHAPHFHAADIGRHLRVPTLVIQGSASPPLIHEVCRALADASSYCSLLELEGANHLSPLFRADDIWAAIRQFSPMHA